MPQNPVYLSIAKMEMLDLEDTRLRVDFSEPGLTKHVSYNSNPSTGQRSIREEEVWRRMQDLGNGTFGKVWLEELVSGNKPVKFRAVKMISKKAQSAAVDYRRELEAMAKFSKPLVKAARSLSAAEFLTVLPSMHTVSSSLMAGTRPNLESTSLCSTWRKETYKSISTDLFQSLRPGRSLLS